VGAHHYIDIDNEFKNLVDKTIARWGENLVLGFAWRPGCVYCEMRSTASIYE
jgi:hypothetical protein